VTNQKARTATGGAVRASRTVAAVRTPTPGLTPPPARGIQPSPAAAQWLQFLSANVQTRPTSQDVSVSIATHWVADSNSLVCGDGEGTHPVRAPEVETAPTLGRPRAGRGGGVPEVEEQHALERSLGATLRAVRAEAGQTQQLLARRSGASFHSIQDLERGRRRPSRAMLEALAVGSTIRIPLAKADPKPVYARLVAAAGASLVVDTPGGVRRRERRLRDAGDLYRRELDAWWDRECAAARRAELAFVTAITILDQPGALDDAAALEAANGYLDVHRDWMGEERRLQPPMWVTSEFRAMARRHGYPVSRKRRVT
jgi:transcriptional regulator with XRE-family HTH domain